MPDIVESVLDMRAEVDLRGDTDEQTALNFCLKNIGMLKKTTKQCLEAFQQIRPDDPVLIETVRRNSFSMFGSTDSEIKKHLQQLASDPTSQEWMDRLRKNDIENQKQRYDYKKLLQISKLLLERGANPNAVHTSPVNGHTPLMLAVEVNEAELVQIMLTKGGDPYHFCTNPLFGDQFKVDCWTIASIYKSHDALKVLGEKR
ncbi:ankyrin repeat domain-containing protein [Pelagibaculum spongiae]|uniref:Uncharacterized protein n=1 Tax=Pelagibaculum spongiae TaxID=2080658 RepID=A0A2V1GXW8_9GAMM|nr:ankyrin repeat domain-containing protein [Pelagibaculum spongiae]PVZ66786.1 hypothetical protein DC094_16110 [Pelagibaculum spongiae]